MVNGGWAQDLKISRTIGWYSHTPALLPQETPALLPQEIPALLP